MERDTEELGLAITGFGQVSALGVGRSAWEDALGGDTDLKKQCDGPGSELGSSIVQVWDWDPSAHLGKKGHRSLDRLTKFQVTAAKYALEDSGLKDIYGPERLGICSATAYGSLDTITELNRVAELEDPRYINPQRFPNTVINSAAGYVSIWQDLRGPNTTIVDGNCGALDALMVASTHLRNRRADGFLVGGGEVASEPLLTALSRLGLRGGSKELRIGEGACLFAVERRDDARARGARILAEVTGFGSSFDPPASEAALVHGSPRAVREAIEEALQNAGVSPAEVSIVVGGRCGIARFDDAEAKGIQLANIRAEVRAPKQFLGETFGASGAFAMAIAIGALERKSMHDDNDGRAVTTKHALVVALGYYGNASAVALRGAQ